MNREEELIKVYKDEIRIMEASAKRWKGISDICYHVALSKKETYERVVEDLEVLNEDNIQIIHEIINRG